MDGNEGRMTEGRKEHWKQVGRDLPRREPILEGKVSASDMKTQERTRRERSVQSKSCSVGCVGRYLGRHGPITTRGYWVLEDGILGAGHWTVGSGGWRLESVGCRWVGVSAGFPGVFPVPWAD
jgi:hypothetical protein